MEYSIVLVLGYFEDTLANVGLPEAWLECDYNCVTQVENKYVRRESNQIEKIIESNQIKTTIESNQIENCESNQVKNGDQKNLWCLWRGSRRHTRWAGL